MSNLRVLKRAVVKEELVALTGELEKAIILNQFIYWSERVNDFDKFIEEEKARAEKEEHEVTMDKQDGWIYKDMEELKNEVMFTSSISTMSRKLESLVNSGWLDRRNNPKYNWDRRYQYRVNLNKISTELFDLGYVLQDYKVDVQELLKSANLQNETTSPSIDAMAELRNFQNENIKLQNEIIKLQNDKALSEITSETTSEIINQSISPSIEQELKQDLKQELIQELKEELKQELRKEVLLEQKPKKTDKQADRISKEQLADINQEIEYIRQVAEIWRYEGDRARLIDTTLKSLLSKETLRVGAIELNKEQIRDKLYELTVEIIDYAFNKFIYMQQVKQITNKAKYFEVLLISAIDEYSANAIY